MSPDIKWKDRQMDPLGHCFYSSFGGTEIVHVNLLKSPLFQNLRKSLMTLKSFSTIKTDRVTLGRLHSSVGGKLWQVLKQKETRES